MSDTNVSSESIENTECTGASWGLIADLDFTVANGLELLYDSYSEVLKTVDVEFDEALFSRFIIGTPMQSGLSALLGFLGQSKDKAPVCADSVRAAFAAKMEDAAIVPAAKAAVGAALKAKGSIIVMSSMDEAKARDIAAKAGIPSAASFVQRDTAGVAHMSAAAWRAAIDSVEVGPRHLIGITSVANSARAALVCGIDVAVIENKFTDFQSFDGVDKVIAANASGAEAAQVFKAISARA